MSSQDGGLPITPSLMSTRVVAGIGSQSVIETSFGDPNISSVGMTTTISACGGEITEFNKWWLGPTIQIVVPANSIWPAVSSDIQLSLNVTPHDQFFPPNSSTTTWKNGSDAVARNEVNISGGSAGDITTTKSLPWVYRLAIVTTHNIRQAHIVLQILPIKLSTLYSMTDPESKDLCVISFPVISAPWSTNPDPAMRFPGPLPTFLDRRSDEARMTGLFPASQLVKKFVSRAMLSGSANPTLESEEINVLVNDPTSHPPFRSATVAVWPDVPPDITQPNSQDTAQSNSQTRGVPVLAQNQHRVLADAQNSIGFQSGLGQPADVPMLSVDAQNRQAVMENLFGDDLPPNLPSWDVLATFPVKECTSFINAKVERAKEIDSGTDAEAFLKATAPITFSTPLVDDGLSQLHPARFSRAPLSEPHTWIPMMEKKRPYVITFLPEDPVGGGIGISDIAIKKMSDRCMPLQLKHILKANSHVEKSAPISKRRAVESSGIGDSCELTYVNDFDYKEAQYPWEVLESLCTAAAVYQQIWPLDYSIINIIRCLVRFQLFYHVEITTKFQMLLCRKFIDEAFLANSRKARSSTPPLSFKQLNELAAEVLRDKKRNINPQHYIDLAAANGNIKPGQNAEAFYAFSMTNLAKAQSQLVKTQQQQLQRVGSYGPSRNGAPGKDARRMGKSSQAIDSKKSKGVQICPAFNKGDPCPRGGDALGSCKAVSGVTLHHICSTCLSGAHNITGHK